MTQEQINLLLGQADLIRELINQTESGTSHSRLLCETLGIIIGTINRNLTSGRVNVDYNTKKFYIDKGAA